MGDVVQKGKSFGICLAPSEADVRSGAARIFGEFAEKLIVENYEKKTGGKVPLNVWTDRVQGPPMPPNSGFHVPPIVLSMFSWLCLRHPQLLARAQQFSDFFTNVGFDSAVPDIIDSRSPRCWYEIKPGSPTGLAAGMEKLTNIPKWIDRRFGLRYQPGTAYNPGPADDVNLLERLPPGFGRFVQMMTAALGGIVRIEIKLSFRRPPTVPGLPSADGLILYWICVTVRFGDEGLVVDEVEDVVRNIARWTVIHVFRAVNGTLVDPTKPLQLTVACKDATIQGHFVPGERELLATVLRSPPATGYTVVGGLLVRDMLREMDRTAALVERLFRPPPPKPLLSPYASAIIAGAALGIVTICLVILAVGGGQPEAAPEAEVAGVAARAAFGAAARIAARRAAERAGEEVLERALQRMAAEAALREGFRRLGQTVAKEGVRRAVTAASTMYVVGASNVAQAAQPGGRSGNVAPGSAAPAQLVGDLQRVHLVPWWDPALVAAMGINAVASTPPAPREAIPLPDGSTAIFLYTIAVTEFPELKVRLTAGLPP